MYNRYVRNDNGDYTRIPEQQDRAGPAGQSGQSGGAPRGGQQARGSQPRQDGPASRGGQAPHPNGTEGRSPPPSGPERGSGRQTAATGMPDGLTGLLRRFLDRLHLDHVDTGDLLLLGLLFFLSREEADEELLVALGLLLIL